MAVKLDTETNGPKKTKDSIDETQDIVH